jgi:hypothetical protein
MSLDLEEDYKKAKDKISSISAFKDLQKQYAKAQKRAGDALEYGGKSLEKSEEKIKTTIDKAKTEAKRYQKEKKDQIDQLLDINKVTGSNSVRYIKTQMIKTIRNIQPQIKEILLEEVIKTTGCDQQQSYPAQTVYVKVKSVDLANMLKLNPTTVAGKVLYEKNPVQIQDSPFSMNRELYNVVQNPDIPYSITNTQDYLGESGQNLFDITFKETNAFGEYGPWFKVDLKNRVNNVNIVGEFLVDYFKTIEVVDFSSVMANIMNSLSGAVSLKVGASVNQVEDASKFERYMARILGLCFDNRNQIDVSGVAKVGELDGIDESFYELTDIDLREVEQKISNFRLGVVEFLDCTTEKLPVNTEQILGSLSNLNRFEGPALDRAASELTDVLANNPEWTGITIKGNIKASLDLNFIKAITQGLTLSLLGPKVLLPIFTMLKAIAAQICGEINGLVDFFLCFKEFIKNLVSRIGAIFVKELFKLIKRDILNLIQSVIKDLQKEKANTKIIIILKLVQILIIVAQFISDWRSCKSVIDEILALLKVATSGVTIPLPLLFASQFLDGFSAARSMIGTIEELQKLGVPTGALPDGSPNLTVLSMMGQVMAQSKEEAENGKVQIALPPLTITPAGLTIPQSAFGKKL